MLSRINSFGNICMQCFPITVECDMVTSMTEIIDIVGLPDAAVRESKERVRSAINNTGLLFPSARITLSLAPADLKKEGAVYDLPILLAILQSDGQLNFNPEGKAFLGEISLAGEVRAIKGVLPMVLCAKEQGLREIYIPRDNAAEASVVEGIDAYAVENIPQLISHLTGEKPMQPIRREDYVNASQNTRRYADFADVKGQFIARRAIEVAAAGGHNILMVGPPGSGKSMLAKRIPSILPEMTFDESIETTKIYSIAGLLPAGLPLISERPFRSPHHTVSPPALAGGGKIPRPGEISLAHNGVLFLDEFPEFRTDALEVLRQPLEDNRVTVSRVSGSFTFPAAAMLVAAMNPCRCGYYGHPTKKCTCKAEDIKKYLSKISGPLLDRIDIQIEVPSISYEEISDPTPAESSERIRERVNAARDFAHKRYKNSTHDIKSNGSLSAADVRIYCVMDDSGHALLKSAFNSLGLSARGHDRLLRVARTIADLEESETIKAQHIAEAIQLRSLDRKYW